MRVPDDPTHHHEWSLPNECGHAWCLHCPAERDDLGPLFDFFKEHGARATTTGSEFVRTIGLFGINARPIRRGVVGRVSLELDDGTVLYQCDVHDRTEERFRRYTLREGQTYVLRCRDAIADVVAHPWDEESAETA